jgi:hypothetical protein
MVLHSLNKGKQGEREAIKLLTEIADPVYNQCGHRMPDLSRNLDQSRAGGYDINSFEWLAIEVKRRESANLKAWWRQTVEQAGPEQTPCLMWRQNRQPWRFRIAAPVCIGPAADLRLGPPLVIDLELDQFALWFRSEIFNRLSA